MKSVWVCWWGYLRGGGRWEGGGWEGVPCQPHPSAGGKPPCCAVGAVVAVNIWCLRLFCQVQSCNANFEPNCWFAPHVVLTTWVRTAALHLKFSLSVFMSIVISSTKFQPKIKTEIWLTVVNFTDWVSRLVCSSESQAEWRTRHKQVSLIKRSLSLMRLS